MMITRFLLVWCFLGAWAALAEDAKAKAAREELEKQLAQMVEHEPSRVRVAFVGLDDLNYRLEEATFELDGKPLKAPPLEVLADEGEHLVWTGDATPGRHKLTVHLVVANGASVVLSDEGGFKWKIGGDVGFDLHAGIEVGLQVKPLRDAAQKDVGKRFKLSLPATPVMIAKLDDGKMPEPIAKPTAVVSATGPTPVAAASPTDAPPPPMTAAEKKRLAVEERKQKAEEARQAKLAAEEERKQAKIAAAEEKRRKIEEAKQAKLALAEERRVAAEQAAEDKRRQAQGLPAEKPTEVAAVPEAAPAPVVPAPAPEPVAAVQAVDAGTPPAPVAAVASPSQGKAEDAASADLHEDEGLRSGLLVFAGISAVVVILVVVARRRARPPTI